MLKWFGAFSRERAARTPGEAIRNPDYPVDWCVAALLYCSVYADNAAAYEEELEFDALLTRARSFESIHPDFVSRYIANFTDILKDHDTVLPLADIALQNMPADPEISAAVFAQCADVMFADSKLVENELAFLDHLAAGLNLPEDTKEEILQVIKWKHAYGC
ncbi:MAG: hypothetical protein RLO80_13105 [Hyphomonas sp.]